MGHFRAARDIGFDNIEVTDDSKRNYDEISMSKILVARHRASTTTRLSIDVKKKDARKSICRSISKCRRGIYSVC